MHDFALTRAQFLIARHQLSCVAVFLPPSAIALKGLLNSIQQLLIVERLREELHRAGFHSLNCHGNVAMRGDKDNGSLHARIRQLPLEIEAVQPRKLHIEDKATRTLRGASSQKFLRTSE